MQKPLSKVYANCYFCYLLFFTLELIVLIVDGYLPHAVLQCQHRSLLIKCIKKVITNHLLK